MFNSIILPLLIFGAFCVLLGFLNRNLISKKVEKEENGLPKIYPYQKKDLLTKAEYKFYMELKEICANKNLIICPKVRFEDFVSVTSNDNKNSFRGYIKSRHIDFLLCDSKLHILAGIELDDESHNSKKAMRDDELKDNVFNAIKLPLYRVQTSNNYSIAINAIIEKYI